MNLLPFVTQIYGKSPKQTNKTEENIKRNETHTDLVCGKKGDCFSDRYLLSTCGQNKGTQTLR